MRNYLIQNSHTFDSASEDQIYELSQKMEKIRYTHKNIFSIIIRTVQDVEQLFEVLLFGRTFLAGVDKTMFYISFFPLLGFPCLWTSSVRPTRKGWLPFMFVGLVIKTFVGLSNFNFMIKSALALTLASLSSLKTVSTISLSLDIFCDKRKILKSNLKTCSLLTKEYPIKYSLQWFYQNPLIFFTGTYAGIGMVCRV